MIGVAPRLRELPALGHLCLSPNSPPYRVAISYVSGDTAVAASRVCHVQLVPRRYPNLIPSHIIRLGYQPICHILHVNSIADLGTTYVVQVVIDHH